MNGFKDVFTWVILDPQEPTLFKQLPLIPDYKKKIKSWI